MTIHATPTICFLTNCYYLESAQPLYSQALQSFRESAREYRQKHQRQAVIIFDNVNYLARHSPELLWELQQLAKGAADRCDFVVVFVCSEGRAPFQLFGERAKVQHILLVLMDISQGTRRNRG